MMTKNSGFTLIELIIVLAMVTIVLSIAAPAVAPFFKILFS